MAIDYGTDISCVFDVDANLSTVGGRLRLAQAVARRWLETPGGLFYSETYGGGLFTYLSGALIDTDEMGSRLEDQAREEDGIEDCAVDITFIASERKLVVNGVLTDGDGPYTFVLNITQVSWQLLVEAA
jgi:hypothetical protein